MTDTGDKLSEARYFLQGMKDCRAERDAFRFNLTAFLSAARSVTQIMQREFGHVPGFTGWYAQKKTEMNNHSVMKYLHEQRNLSYHVRPVHARADASLTLFDRVTVTDTVKVVLTGTGGEVKMDRSDSKPQVAPSATAAVEMAYYFEDFPARDVISICEEDLSELEKLVNDCEGRSWQS